MRQIIQADRLILAHHVARFLDLEERCEGVAVEEAERGEHVILHQPRRRQPHIDSGFALIQKQIVLVEELGDGCGDVLLGFDSPHRLVLRCRLVHLRRTLLCHLLPLVFLEFGNGVLLLLVGELAVAGERIALALLYHRLGLLTH